MTRLTIASLTSELAALNISLTGKTGAYTVVFPTGYSQTHNTLAEVKQHVDQYFEQNTAQPKIKPQTEPTEAEAYNTQYVRNEQLFNELHSQGLPAPDFAHTTPYLDEERMGEALVNAADERREAQQMINDFRGCEGNTCPATLPTLPEDSIDHTEVAYKQFNNNHSQRYTFGFNCEMTARVNGKLQRRANKFHALLACA